MQIIFFFFSSRIVWLHKIYLNKLGQIIWINLFDDISRKIWNNQNFRKKYGIKKITELEPTSSAFHAHFHAFMKIFIISVTDSNWTYNNVKIISIRWEYLKPYKYRKTIDYFRGELLEI